MKPCPAISVFKVERSSVMEQFNAPYAPAVKMKIYHAVCMGASGSCDSANQEEFEQEAKKDAKCWHTVPKGRAPAVVCLDGLRVFHPATAE